MSERRNASHVGGKQKSGNGEERAAERETGLKVLKKMTRKGHRAA